MNLTKILIISLLIVFLLNFLIFLKFIKSKKNVQNYALPDLSISSVPALIPLSKLKDQHLEDLSLVIEEIKQESILIENQKIRDLCLFLQNAVLNERQLENFVLINEKSSIKFKDRLLTYHKDLSDTDLELCSLIIQNKSGKEIAETLNLTYGTIRVYKNKLKIKLGLSGQNSINKYLKNIYKTY